MLARIAKLYQIEAEVRGQPADVRRAIRQERSRPLVEDLQRWLQEHLPRLPGWSDLAKAMRYALAHWDGLISSDNDYQEEQFIRRFRRWSPSLGDRQHIDPVLQTQRR